MKKKIFLLLFILVMIMPFSVKVLATEDEVIEDEVVEDEVVETPHEHSYTINVVEPTCKNQGYTEYTCSCGYSYKDNYTEKLKHTEVLLNGIDATCTTPGLTVGLVCSVCKEVTVEPSEIPVLGHRAENFEIILEATEETEGIRKGTCLDCGVEFSEKYKLEKEEVEDIPVNYPCKVVIKDSEYGDILIDIEEGNVGDIVTIYAKPYSFCKLIKLTVNGVDLMPNEEGNYQFPLVEGENVITSKFEIDSEQFKEVAELLAKAKDGDWAEIFTIENIFIFIYTILSLFMGSGYCVTLLKSKKIKTETTTDVANTVTGVLNSNVYNAVKNFLSETFGPTFDKLSGSIVNIEDVVKMMARCMILSQENTPEARLAIIDELTKIQKNENDLSDQVKAIIQKEVEKAEAIQKQKLEAIDELKKANDELVQEAKTEEVDVNENSEGRY